MKYSEPHCSTCKSREKSLLCACSFNELSEIDANKSFNTYKKGQVVFQEGGLPLGMYCINEGVVKLVKLGSNGKEQILRIAKQGDFLGYRSLLVNSRYRASAVAIEDTALCMVPKSSFMKLVKENTAFHEGVTKLLCDVIESADNKTTDIAYKPVRGRIAEALLMLDRTFDDREQITMTREDLASFVGTVKETAIRIISEFKNDKLIEINKRSIRVIDAEGLVKISNLYD